MLIYSNFKQIVNFHEIQLQVSFKETRQTADEGEMTIYHLNWSALGLSLTGGTCHHSAFKVSEHLGCDHVGYQVIDSTETNMVYN
jgi:hypothetical protein